MSNDLWRWTHDPLALLRERAATATVFEVRLWRRAVVGYRPEWNRAILGDPETFRAAGSLSGLTPYLAGGVVHTDAPAHQQRRGELNPHYHRRSLAGLLAQLDAVAQAHAPRGPFEAMAWASTLTRRMLNTAFFGGGMPDRLLREFLDPLHRRLPQPLLPRPLLFARMDRAIAAQLARPRAGTLAASLGGLAGAGEEIRVALAAGYDTTAHTLAWAIWHLAGAPQPRTPDGVAGILDEVLRLYPAGWIGSRVCVRDTQAAATRLPAGTLVLYSPYLTHRDASLWPDPTAFEPGRFASGLPAWGYLPFGAGRRTCLGTHLARAMLRAALVACLPGTLTQLRGDPTPRAALTLRPAGPLWLVRNPAETAAPTAGSTSLCLPMGIDA